MCSAVYQPSIDSNLATSIGKGLYRHSNYHIDVGSTTQDKSMADIILPLTEITDKLVDIARSLSPL